MKNNLINYHQEHLLTYVKELDRESLDELANDISKIDFKLMNKLYLNSFKNTPFDLSKCEPCPHIKEKVTITDNAIKLIKNNGYAICIMAGGNGSRLGYNGPKGCVKLKIKDKELSLFEIYLNKLKEIYSKYKVYIPIYIMTSTINNKETIKFFEDNKYFNYPKNKIKFFVQDNLPILSESGKILLKDKSHILFGPNGNGNVFQSLKKNKLLKNMQKQKIKYVLFMGIDNVLAKPVDLNLLEIIIKNNYPLVSKSITKLKDTDMSGVFCKYNGLPSVIGGDYITKEINNLKDSNGYMYRDKNAVYHIIEINEIKKYANIDLEYHRAHKKTKYLDLLGNYIEPDKPNSFKFERLIYDAFKYTKEMYLYPIKEDEFMHIKTKEDLIKVETYLNKEI